MKKRTIAVALVALLIALGVIPPGGAHDAGAAEASGPLIRHFAGASSSGIYGGDNGPASQANFTTIASGNCSRKTERGRSRPSPATSSRTFPSTERLRKLR